MAQYGKPLVKDSQARSLTALAESHVAKNLVPAGSRPECVVAFERAVVAFFVETADVLGVPKSVAAIYGICFSSAEPLSFADIGTRLSISKGSISQGLRVLRDAGALKVRSTRGQRVDRFEPDLELRNLMLRFLDHRLSGHLNEGETRLAEIEAAIPDTIGTAAQIVRGRIRSLKTWHNKGRALLPLIKGFLKLT